MTTETERQKRILTTHVGSLPRPDALSEMMAEGKVDPAAVKRAVADIVRQQVESGVDIIDDGEQSKPGFVAYVSERLAGLEPIEGSAPQLTSRERVEFPDFYAHGHSGTAPPRMATTGPIKYAGHAQLKADIDNLKAAAAAANVVDIFMPSA